MAFQTGLHFGELFHHRFGGFMRFMVAEKAIAPDIFESRVLRVIIIDVGMDWILREGLRFFCPVAERAIVGVKLILMAKQAVRHLGEHTVLFHAIGFNRVVAHHAIQPQFDRVEFVVVDMGLRRLAAVQRNAGTGHTEKEQRAHLHPCHRLFHRHFHRHILRVFLLIHLNAPLKLPRDSSEILQFILIRQ